ncbi:MAG: MmcQ/YjbR family DNA-binding protein [Ferruginibacter sp.]
MNLYSFHEKVSKIALQFPEAYEKPCYGSPGFFTKKKMFARIKEDGQTLVVYNDDRDEWIASDGEIFFYTDHYKNYPLLLVDLKRVSKADLNILVTISWKIRASKKLLALFSG